MSSFKERLHALINSRSLGEVVVDLACYRRLEALRDRMVKEDPQLATEEDALQHVAYAALMSGLQALEAEAGVRYDDNTGLRML